MSAISRLKGAGGQAPFVSVVVPAYNAMKTITACLESLVAQDYPVDRREIIVVDNNSSDETVAIAARYPVRLLHERSRQSSYAARNCGINAAQGALVAFTDADCVADPTWLARLVEGSGDEAVGAFAGRVLALHPRTVLEQFAQRRRQVSQDASMACSFLPYAITANVAYRRELLSALGRFDERLISGGDADLSWRLQRMCGKTIRFNREAVVFHQHRSSFRSFWNQHRLYGFGTAMLYERFPGYRKSLGYEAWFWLRRAGYFFVRGISRLARLPMRRHEPPIYFAEHFLEVACTTARFLGMLSYHATGREHSASGSVAMPEPGAPREAPGGEGQAAADGGLRRPSVSVIIPSYNRAHLLGPTLESVLAQSYQDMEVIVVDDGSRDQTRAVVQSYVPQFNGRLFYIFQRNQGLSGARNTGCRVARGRYLAFLDSDDLWQPEKLATQVPILDADPAVGLVSSMAEVINVSGDVVRIKPAQLPGSTLQELVARGTAPPSTFVVRREAIADVGYFDPLIRHGLEDLDLGFRLAARRWKMVCLEEPLIRYRLHDSNLSLEPVGTYQGYARAYDKLLTLSQAEIPRRTVRHLAGKYHYLLGVAYGRRGEVRAACGEFFQAIRLAPLVGLTFAADHHPWWRRWVMALKPYAAVCGLALASLGSLPQHPRTG